MMAEASEARAHAQAAAAQRHARQEAASALATRRRRASHPTARPQPGGESSCSTGHAGREERPTLSAGQILILRLPLTVGPFFCFFFPLGLRTIPLL